MGSSQEGGSHGSPSEISRVNISNAAKKRSENEEWRRKQSESHIGLQTGDKNGMYGKKHTEEAKQKQKEASLGKHPSDETRSKMSESHRGERNVMYGKKHSDEFKQVSLEDLFKSMEGDIGGAYQFFSLAANPDMLLQIFDRIYKYNLQVIVLYNLAERFINTMGKIL